MTVERTLMMANRSGPTVIGQAYGGGFYAGKIAAAGGGVATHYLIVAPKATGESSSKMWKTTNTATTGTTSAINGPANSAAMNNASHPAALFCEGLTIGGYSDWYMPAINELEVLYYFLKPSTAFNDTGSGKNINAVSPEPINQFYTTSAPAKTSAVDFQSGGPEAFVTGDPYWSSTQFDVTQGRYQLFQNGGQSSVTKMTSYYVRAVRRIPI